MKHLPEDLQRIFNVGAKVYEVSTKRMGNVTQVNRSDDKVTDVTVDYGNKASAEISNYTIDEFSELLLNDKIVSRSRLTMGDGKSFRIKPRLGQPAPVQKPPQVTKSAAVQTPVKQSVEDLKVAYINEKTGRFSKTKKKGYVKIEYRKATQPVTLEVDDEMLAKLKELGLV